MLYSIKPYACLSVGGMSIIFCHHALATCCGITLYALGALIWMIRFHYNRYPAKRIFFRSGTLLPEGIYEFKPFILLLCSLFLFSIHPNALVTGISLAIVADSIYIFFKRHQKRPLKKFSWVTRYH